MPGSKIILTGGGPAFGLPEVSPYVTKTEVQLTMACLPYEKRFDRPESSPKGQLPWIEDAGERIADSTFIRAYLERAYGVDLDAGLSQAERAQAWTIERMLENHLGWVMAYYRFLPENFAKGPAHWFDEAPEAMREALRAGLLDAVRQNLMSIGIMRHTPEEILWLGEKSLTALAVLLDEKPFLFGERPTGTDAFAFAVLAQSLTPVFESPLRDAIEARPALVAYTARMMKRFYPDFEWTAREALPEPRSVVRRTKWRNQVPPSFQNDEYSVQWAG